MTEGLPKDRSSTPEKSFPGRSTRRQGAEGGTTGSASGASATSPSVGQVDGVDGELDVGGVVLLLAREAEHLEGADAEFVDLDAHVGQARVTPVGVGALDGQLAEAVGLIDRRHDLLQGKIGQDLVGETVALSTFSMS